MDKQNYELAEEDYINGMKYKEIAEKYNVSINTVKSWKTRYKWCKDKKGMHTKSKKVCTQNKKSAGAKKNNECGIKEPIADEVKEVMENEELTDKQRLFCIFYSKCFNATKAYLKAYTCTYETANAEGYKLLVNPCIKKQIDELTKIRFNKEALKSGVLQKYIDIAFADLGDYLKFGKKTKGVWTKDKDGVDTPVIDPDTGQQKIKEYSYVDLKESISVDTSLITEVSEGKDGIKIKLADKMKALDFLNKHLNLLSDEDKVKLDIANKQLQNQKLQLQNDKLGNKGKDEKINIVIKRKERE
ncbi:MAG: terminase small subunit [Clostridioides difficile]|uniref:terminase small subunit n=2 Tax=Clostridium butyricum TaxID=1492 RepID=UPI0002C9E8C2|nr:terminase small subunit [Clostridium butyricum]EMU52273.1 pbsx phage terminase small subunit [Clostridium butyricum DKU-01]MDU4852780.1 terminase small subunit [Clostridioides difficile]